MLKCDEFIIYRCNICNCIFGIDKKRVKHAEKEDEYITCPLHGKHRNINVIGFEEWKILMENNKDIVL